MKENVKLPWWTWVVPIMVLHMGTEISRQFIHNSEVSDLYLPTGLSVIMINWWGPARIIPAMYLNAALSASLWGIEDAYQWPLFALPETILTFCSWLLFTKLNKGKYWMPDVRALISFFGLAMFVPLIVDQFFLERLFIYFGQHAKEDFWYLFIRNSLGETAYNLGLSLPVLYYATPYLQRRNLLINPPSELIKKHSFVSTKTQFIELAVIYLSLLLFTFLVSFEKFWFVYGLFSIYTALRFGFGVATITSYFIIVLTYLTSKLSTSTMGWTDNSHENVINILLGMLLLYIFAAITGRVIGDLKYVKIKLQRKNDELGRTNSELDRFVYSVSHDLSAPLKSIRGLVNVSRLEKPGQQGIYLNQIESSVNRLENFITEILDYSRNNRLPKQPEPVNLKELSTELLNNLKYIDRLKNINIDLDGLDSCNLITDKSRLKIILNNLLSNAIKFHRKSGDNLFIRVSATNKPNALVIQVEDNGQGIRQEYQDRIFEMFYRATETEKGSGLGLYIAKEAIEKIGGKISFQSEYGKGTKFTVEIPTPSSKV
ncbi:MAG TPA: ATP-binding protein [Cyclobacteriaceae bacterium]|nr:ATP-binding protein [Cyclobacteriaceae bacterium]